MPKLFLPSHTHSLSSLDFGAAAAAAAAAAITPNKMHPPPAHQSPRQVPFAAHPLPAHLHPVLNVAAGGAALANPQQLHPQIAPMYVGSPGNGAAYLAHALTNKNRQLPVQYVYEDALF